MGLEQELQEEMTARQPKPPLGPARFVQIMSGAAGYGNVLFDTNVLFALDANGRVWEYIRPFKGEDHWRLLTNERKA